MDGTDVRLLKLLAKKFGFAYNITNPSSYYAAIKMVCNSDLSFYYIAICRHFFSPTTERQIYFLQGQHSEMLLHFETTT